ncbi:MAG: dihydrolipoyl dehydrogenase [Kiloniellales bacterium]
MAEQTYDLAVIGGGPGGYVAAIRAAQLGMKTACIDERPTLGGTCLNVGCIPSKALLNSSERFLEAQHGLAAHGIKVGEPRLDLKAMMARKDKVVGDLTKGVAFLLRKNKVDHLIGRGQITGVGEVAVTPAKGAKKNLKAKTILIATGSEVMPLPGVEIDEERIVSSTGALTLAQVPKHLVVIGAGYIGLELGSVWRRLGAEVTVVELLERITPGMDAELARQLQRVLTKQGLAFRLGTKVTGAARDKARVTLTLEPAAGGKGESLEADVVLVAVGRRPNTEGLGLEAVGVHRDNHGFIEIDRRFATNVPGIHAIGDVVRGPMLAHKAEDEGVVCVEMLAGQSGHIDYDAIPGIVYTWPEAAGVGKTEDELKEAGTDYRVGRFPFTANARARAISNTDGFVKVLADAGTGRVLGVHILGPDAGTLIHECVLAMEFGASAEDIARTCHGHPTLAEAVKEAALAACGRPIHI